MAGISGPCPSCSATIQAPKARVEAPPAETTVQPAPAPALESEPTLEPEPSTEQNIRPSSREESTRTFIRPVPRTKPERNETKEIEAHLSTLDASLRPRQKIGLTGRDSSETRTVRSIRILVPLFFIIAGGTLVYGLCYYFLPGGPGESYRSNIVPPTEPQLDLQPDLNGSGYVPPMPTIRPGTTRSIEPVEDPPPISANGADAIDAESLLNRFLETKTLEERLPMIDPPMTADQLQGTILSEPFPEAIGVSSETPAFDPIEKLTHFPFRVSFQGGEGSVVDYTIVVRKRADLAPQVAVQPLLDLLGGRLAKFAATPTAGVHTFHAVIEAMPRCFEENVPEPSKKFTYKLSACDIGRSTARAYARLSSSLAEELSDPNSRIRWGKRIRATITLQWNATEDPSQPYIELLEIKSLDWNS